MHKKRQQNKWICVFCLQPLVITVINPRLERLVVFEKELHPSPLKSEQALFLVMPCWTRHRKGKQVLHQILEPYPSPLTGEGERSSDEGDIKTSSKRRACYGLSNLFKHNGRLKSTLHGFHSWHLNISEKGGCKSQQFQDWHLYSNVKGGCKSQQFQTWHLNISEKGGKKTC